ncbi:MAG: transglutaminase-like cysteine peptidase [Gallionella sp.]
MILFSRLFRTVCCLLFFSSSAVVAAGFVDFSPGLLRYVASRWGRDAPDRLNDWHTEISNHLANQQAAPSSSEIRDDLEDFNWYWNKVHYYTDMDHWHTEDYWATPVETLASEGADCEDYAIGKYFSLKALGVPMKKLRITYVRALRWNEPHMVLAYYPTPDADPYILDNLKKSVLHASDRPDLVPVYSFNDEDLWLPGVTTASGKSSQIRLWNGVLDKMAQERNR